MNVMIVSLAALMLATATVHAKVDHTPVINSKDVRVDPIMNNRDPVFYISGITVDVPGLKRHDANEVCEVRVVITSSGVRDTKTNELYRVTAIVEDLAFVGTDETWIDSSGHVELAPYRKSCRVRLALSGGPIPLRKGMVKGNISVLLIAVYADRAGNVYESEKKFPISVSN